jgi:hypothetical protein
MVDALWERRSKTMRFITITLFSIAAALSVRPAQAQTLYTCGDGSIRTVRAITEMVALPPVVVTIDPLGEPQTLVERPPDEPRQAVLVTVQLFNALYTGEAFSAGSENFDPTRVDEDETISICVNRDRMILHRSDGTDFRANIIRMERSRQPTGTR